MSGAIRMVIDDPAKFHLLTTDMKKQVITAGISTVNIVAAKARKEAIKNLESNFNARNTFTKRQIQYTPMPQVKYISLSEIHSTIGVTEKASYMLRQEEGGEHVPRQGSKLAIPTDVARGGTFSNPVQRGMMMKDVVTKRKRVHGESSARLKKYKGKGKDIPKGEKITTHTRKSLLVSRAYIAHKHNLFLPMGSKKERNIFRVTEINFLGVAKGKGRRERERHRNVEFETEQVYNFEHEKTTTPPRPWFYPACEKADKDFEKIFASQMKKEGL